MSTTTDGVLSVDTDLATVLGSLRDLGYVVVAPDDVPQETFDPVDLVRWAELYGHPEEWAKKAQALHGNLEAAMSWRGAATEATQLAERLADAIRRIDRVLNDEVADSAKVNRIRGVLASLDTESTPA